MKGYFKMTDGDSRVKVYSNEFIESLRIHPRYLLKGSENYVYGTRDSEPEKILKDVLFKFSFRTFNDEVDCEVFEILTMNDVQELREQYGLTDDDIVYISQEIFDKVVENLFQLGNKDVFDISEFVSNYLNNLKEYLEVTANNEKDND